MPAIHSDLPIVTPDPPRRSQADRYGGLFYLGIGGLVVVFGLLCWFGASVWSLRGVFRDIYTLHDTRRPVSERLAAAFALRHDQRVTQQQYWDMALRRELPPLARYLLADGLTEERVAEDPRAYTFAVASSPDWPDWLRLLALRPLASAAADGYELPAEPLLALRNHRDPSIRLWTAFILAARAEAAGRDDRGSRAALEHEREPSNPNRQEAGLLLDALSMQRAEREQALDRAKDSLRTKHPEAAKIWQGWEIRNEAGAGAVLAPR